jgi:dephospho-CoA kinase
MVKRGKKPVIGIVGGVCSGKSTATRMLARRGCAVIDADEIAHELLNKKDIRSKVAGIFGGDILDESGKISRRKLAEAVFADRRKLKALTNILHPPVLRRVEQLMVRYSKDKKHKAVVLDVPLLLETGLKKRCDRIIFIDSKPSIRLKRGRKTGFFDARALKIRENLQISLDKKKLIADNIVDNNSDLSGLSKQITIVFSGIMDNR